MLALKIIRFACKINSFGCPWWVQIKALGRLRQQLLLRINRDESVNPVQSCLLNRISVSVHGWWVRITVPNFYDKFIRLNESSGTT